MYTLILATIVICIVQHIKFYKKAIEHKESFNPLEHGLINWMFYVISTAVTIGVTLFLWVKYLP